MNEHRNELLRFFLWCSPHFFRAGNDELYDDEAEVAKLCGNIARVDNNGDNGHMFCTNVIRW